MTHRHSATVRDPKLPRMRLFIYLFIYSLLFFATPIASKGPRMGNCFFFFVNNRLIVKC